jgi:hypothetical protein
MTMPRTKTGVRIPFWRTAMIGTVLIGGIVAAEQIEVGFRGPSYPEFVGANSSPTGEKPESKLWFNDLWWGILWSTSGNAYHIHWLDPVTQDWVDTGTAVDDRSASRADVLWDGQRLYVVSHIFSETGMPAFAGERGQLYRFSYGPTTRTYHLDSGFPVEVTGGTSETLVLEKDSTSQLWVTYVENGKVMVNHSVNGNDGTWARPFVLPVPGADQLSADDISSIIAFKPGGATVGFIGVMWSDQTFRTLADTTKLTGAKMNFAVHPDGQLPSAWLGDVIFSHGDDHINLKSLQRDRDGNVFGAIKTEQDSAKTVVLLVCKSSLTGCRTKSQWAAFEVYRSTDEFDPTRPLLLIDAEKRELYVFAAIEMDIEGGEDERGIFYKKSLADDIRFPSGIGVPFIVRRATTDTDVPDINNPTSTKQNLNSVTGLVVLASDENSMHYFHNSLDLK